VRLVLASRSPQRREILARLGVRFEPRDVDVEELAAGPPREVALENARRKAHAAETGDGEVVVACDTVVALDDRIFGKPADLRAARATLEALAGREHRVHSGLCVLDDEGERSAVSVTRVTFRPLDRSLMNWYLDLGEWRDRAGAYAVQGRGAALVERIDGDYLGVVGLPVATLLDLLPDLLTRFAGPLR
jgi:septum formation protein